MKPIKYYQINTLQEDKTNSTLVIDVLKSENFPHKLYLKINVDGKEHELKLLIADIENIFRL